MLNRPTAGRVFFEEVISENPDMGRPSQVQLLLDRRVSRRTSGRFQTPVITDGMIPSLHVDYKNSRIKLRLGENPFVLGDPFQHSRRGPLLGAPKG